MQNPYAGARFLTSCAALQQLPADEQPEIAFAGRSNAGKSSALNTLCAQKHLARVSKTPGRTQMINLFDVPGGRFADLPGYGYAKVAHGLRDSWGALIGAYLDGRPNLAAIVLIMDVRHPLMDADRQMVNWTVARGLPCHILLTKADKLGFGAAKAVWLSVSKELREQPGMSCQLFSATTRQGLEEAVERITGFLSRK